MDWRSHRLFGSMLLEITGKDKSNESWSVSPNLDRKFLRRYRRHKFSVIDDIYTDGIRYFQSVPEEKIPDESYEELDYSKRENVCIFDKDAVVLCVASHLYLDMFNGCLAPFGILYPIFPGVVMKDLDLSENEDGPNILVEELRKISITEKLAVRFYGASNQIMQEFAKDMSGFSLEDIVSIFVYRLATHANMDKREMLYRKTMSHIYTFTGNDRYMKANIRSEKDACMKFEHSYAKIVDKFSEFM